MTEFFQEILKLNEGRVGNHEVYVQSFEKLSDRIKALANNLSSLNSNSATSDGLGNIHGNADSIKVGIHPLELCKYMN